LTLLGGRLTQRPLPEWAWSIFIEPLTTTALLATLPAALLLGASIGPGWFVPASLCALWLAGLWLVLVEVRGGPHLFPAFQGARTLAVGLAVTAWLQQRPWLAGGLRGLLDPRSLLAYGVGFAALGIGWAVVRVLRRRRPDAPALPEWPDVPAFDGLVT